jgi:hypothetical protein
MVCATENISQSMVIGMLEHHHAYATFMLSLPLVHLPVASAAHVRGNLGSGCLLADVAKRAGLPNNHQRESFENLLQIYSIEHKHSQTHRYGHFYFRMWDSCPKFVRIFQLLLVRKFLLHVIYIKLVLRLILKNYFKNCKY